MPKLSAVLHLLLLVFLLGWLGIAQPASAQQTVTLSGRVTDTAGQPVSGATVSLEDPGWVGQETDANGAYRLSVPPGTYRLRVWPPRSPLIAQNIEGLRLSTDTIRNFVLEEGVTLSGQVTANGQPAPWAFLWVVNDEGQEVSFNSANESGHYSLGVPAGTYQVNVYHEDFFDTTVEGVEVSQATVLNITLDSGVLLEGKVVDDTGQPVPDAQVCARLPAEEAWEGICSETGPEGRFQLRVHPAEYVVTATPLAPLHPTRLRLEASGERVPNLTLAVSQQPMPFVPDDPPKAALINISSPTADGEVTVTGAAGAVAPGSTVFIATLETGHFTTAQATNSGSFMATLFAPAGTSVLIKADPVGTSVAQFLYLLFETDQAAVQKLSALPGTILRVADPPGAGIPVGGAGRTHGEVRSLPAWTFHGSINTHTLAPGDPLRVHGTVRVDSPALQGVDALQVIAGLQLERLSAADGSGLSRRSILASSFLTPTGLPIEREPLWVDWGLSRYQEGPLVKTSATRAEAEVDLTLTLPPDLPAGYYRPFISFGFPDMPRENPPSLPVIRFVEGSPHHVLLPIITVGNPVPPRLDWVLLLDSLSNGSRGAVAIEDTDRFAVAQRILTPSETFVIPRLDAASGQPLTYRLEPFVPAVSFVSGSFGNIPTLPRIPFRFPSGSLTMRIRHPDGTETVSGLRTPFVQSRLQESGGRRGLPLRCWGRAPQRCLPTHHLDPRLKSPLSKMAFMSLPSKARLRTSGGIPGAGVGPTTFTSAGSWPWILRCCLAPTLKSVMDSTPVW